MKLAIIMIIFAVVIAFGNSIIDYIRLKDEVLKNNQFQVHQIEETINYSLRSIEKAYFIFDENTESRMKASTQHLLALYESNPSFEEWDFNDLKEMLGVDIYIINEQNVIIHSSFKEDVGLDFSSCCAKLAKVLDERRMSGKFFADGMDIEQQTGKIKKYSYMATPDKKFLFELGYTLQDGVIFHEFNFLNVINELEQRYHAIDEINVLNMGGYSLGTPVKEKNLTQERREAFEKTLKTQRTSELKVDNTIYRYVPYVSDFDQSSTKNKVIEITYNQNELQSILGKNLQTFLVQLVIVLIATIFISLIISKWVSRPMYLAFHDSLTGLKNRAAFDDILQKQLAENKEGIALVIIDIDNFKCINETLGHDAGDHFLKTVAEKIQHIVRNEDITIRLGGDEFVLIMPSVTKQLAGEVAEEIIQVIKGAAEDLQLPTGQVTASVGIALSLEHGNNPEVLYKKADLALYASKERGKNTVHIYHEGSNTTI